METGDVGPFSDFSNHSLNHDGEEHVEPESDEPMDSHRVPVKTERDASNETNPVRVEAVPLRVKTEPIRVKTGNIETEEAGPETIKTEDIEIKPEGRRVTRSRTRAGY